MEASFLCAGWAGSHNVEHVVAFWIQHDRKHATLIGHADEHDSPIVCLTLDVFTVTDLFDLLQCDLVSRNVRDVPRIPK